ncbi:MAG: response regulator transcription factor [Bacillota bacterium]|nr:response regulator transcription factor [Bacillota bacterium]
MFRVLVVDDEQNARNLIKTVLEREGFEVLLAQNGQVALEIMHQEQVDLLIVDVMMPIMDGFSFTEEVRRINSYIPILMITAKQTIADKKHGFLLGIDDYMVKPVDLEEMMLRIYALLRRAKISLEKKIIIKNTILDYDTFTVQTGQECMELPKQEFLLLFHLLSYKGKIFTRRNLLENVWNLSDSDEHTIDVHINRLRNRFKENADFEIVTVRGLGYKAVEK